MSTAVDITQNGHCGRGCRLHRAVVEVLGSRAWSWSSAPVGSVVQVVGSGSGSSRWCQVVALARLRQGGAGVLVDSCGSAGRRGAAVSRAAAAPLVVRLVVVLVVLGSASVKVGSAWRSFSHAIGLVRGVEGVSGQTVKGFT